MERHGRDAGYLRRALLGERIAALVAIGAQTAIDEERTVVLDEL